MMNLAQKAFNGLYSTQELQGPDGLTLEMVLSNTVEFPFRLQDFSDYLKQTYCNENLLFYQSVIDYKEKSYLYFKETTFEFTTKEVLKNKKEEEQFEILKKEFEMILSNFILSDAPQEINLPYEIRHQLLQSYQLEQSYHPKLLFPACTAIIELLRISAFIPFATDANRLSLYQKKLSSITIESSTSSFLKRFTSFSTKSRTELVDNNTPPRLTCWKQIHTDLSQFKPTPMTSNSKKQ